MKNKSHDRLHVFVIGLAIFAMFFGAGNLIYPFIVGLESGEYTVIGLAGFLVSAVLLPFAGLFAVSLFDGNYYSFFNRLGDPAGKVLIFLCMLIIGPGLAIPRIVMVSHAIMAPFLPMCLSEFDLSSTFLFAIIFLSITFLASYRQNRIVDLLGYVTAPLLITSLSIIIGKGLASGSDIVPAQYSRFETFTSNFIRGYETLDLLASIFLFSIVMHIIKNRFGGMVGFNRNKLAIISQRAGIIGITLLACMYIGMAFMSMYHSHDLLPSGDIFRELSLAVLSSRGAAIIMLAVSMAFLSTTTALSAVIAEYAQFIVFRNKVSYETSLFCILILCLPLSTFGLDYVLEMTAGPITYIGYPVIIALTFCNILYKVIGFKPVKLPVAITFIVALLSYLR